MQGRGHGKERQMNYEGENTLRDVGVCFVCHRRSILIVNAQKTNRDTVGAAAVVQASAQISVIRARVRRIETSVGVKISHLAGQVWQVVQPGVWATSRSSERSTNPLSTL